VLDSPVTYAQRRERLAECAVARFLQEVVQEEKIVSQMNERQFVAYYQVFEGLSKQEAEILWKEQMSATRPMERRTAQGIPRCQFGFQIWFAISWAFGVIRS
jgi:hypothetical protein